MLVAAGVLVTLLVFAWWLRSRFTLVTVLGLSMAPTFGNGDRVLVSRVPAGRIRAGEIVVISFPAQEPGRQWIIKRVAAVGGERVPDWLTSSPGLTGAAAVPAGSLVVIGDNREASLDSRQAGFLPADQVLGVVRRRMRAARGVNGPGLKAG
ncbi:S26 family signal peptidase [Nonomuraea sp. SBT364]|uniref:S26 family signal peptidase n=1 Tax=Nonomuraea sp. SBT364 TaxID=1580530 RepID=UPI00066A6B85|nr:S26 family signal peptidase [Nonomuraea sp. SBT364]